jgi:predicted enzyme related to lactoylglutathione lyase
MSTKTKSKSTQAGKNNPAASIVWFEIPADDPQRAKKFYNSLFGWKINPFPEVKDYWHIDTGGSDESLDGGMLPRKHSKQPITTYINVPSVTRSAAKVEKLGGKIMKPRTAVPQMGYFVICKDTENNEFAIWEANPNAK